MGPTDEGTPQGGPLSPLLSNLVLDDLDRELRRRGLRFAHYADDCNIYVRSERAGQRVMKGVTHFLTTKLKLKVNESKSRWLDRGSGSSWDSASRMEKSRSGHYAESSRPLQGAHPGTDAANRRHQPGTNGRKSRQLLSWLARILRLLPDSFGAARPGLVDTAALA